MRANTGSSTRTEQKNKDGSARRGQKIINNQLPPASKCGVRKPAFQAQSSRGASHGAGRLHLRELPAGKHYIFQSSLLEDLSAVEV